MVVFLLILPAFSAASIMATAMLSFTLEPGLKNSNFANTLACAPSVTRFNFTNGVLPTNSVTLFAMFIDHHPYNIKWIKILCGPL